MLVVAVIMVGAAVAIACGRLMILRAAIAIVWTAAEAALLVAAAVLVAVAVLVALTRDHNPWQVWLGDRATDSPLHAVGTAAAVG